MNAKVRSYKNARLCFLSLYIHTYDVFNEKYKITCKCFQAMNFKSAASCQILEYCNIETNYYEFC